MAYLVGKRRFWGPREGTKHLFRKLDYVVIDFYSAAASKKNARIPHPEQKKIPTKKISTPFLFLFDTSLSFEIVDGFT